MLEWIIAGVLLWGLYWLMRGPSKISTLKGRVRVRGDCLHLVKRNDGRCVDCKLPAGTVRTDKRLTKLGGGYSPDERGIKVESRSNKRRLRHEKGHVIWDLRLSKAQRTKFDTLAKKDGYAPKSKKQFGYAADEELFAIQYAGHKGGRKFAKPYKKFFDEVLRK